MELCPVNAFCFDKNTFILVAVTIIVIIAHYIGGIDNKLINIEKNIESNEIRIDNKISKYNTHIGNNSNVEHSAVTKHVHQVGQPQLYKERIDNPLMAPERSYSGHMPNINIATQGEPTGFQQVGILIQEDGSGNNQTKLPLYGEQIYPRSREWRYYVGSDNYQSVKLGLTYEGRDSMDRHGCSELYDGNSVDVKGYDSKFKVTMYKLDIPKYLPHVV
tara:strand:+ start:1965 stop:2618 length:654 start_codon:yes stop_codon:yes gene_type:complete